MEVLVADEQMASELQFRGSPTIRINGLDITGEPSNSGAFACRLYPGSQQIGVPPIEMVRRALTQARNWGTPSRKEKASAFSILAGNFRFGRHDWLLPPDWIRGGTGCGCGKCFLHDTASVALGALGWFYLESDSGNSTAPNNVPPVGDGLAMYCFGRQWWWS